MAAFSKLDEVKALSDIRVFVSSTFNDMNEERDYLARQIFPAVKAYARRRTLSFHAVDLRWGITKEESEAHGVVKACFDEIDRSSPFFIGITGNRYGWAPAVEDFGNDYNEIADRASWIDDAVKKGTSITEMEFLYGALERRDEKVNAWFYVKDNGVCDDRVTALRQKLDSQTHFPVKRYRDVEELGAMIYDDLVARIDSLFPETYSDPYHNELRRNEYILADNLAKMVDFDPEVYTTLNNWLRDNNRPAVAAIYARNTTTNGNTTFNVCGKSMLLCSYVSKLRAGGRPAVYFDMATCNADDVINECRRFVDRQLSSTKSPDRILVTVDNADFGNQVEHTAFIDYINLLSATNKVLISTRYGETIMKLSAECITCPELSDNSIDALIDRYLAMHGKKLSPSLRELLPHDPSKLDKLKLLLDHLVRFGSFDKLENEVETSGKCNLFWKLAADVREELSDRSQSWEPMWVLNALAVVGEAGFSEDEILSLTNMKPLRWAMIRERILELCRRRGKLYVIENLHETRTILRDLYYTNFRDMIIMRILTWLKDNDVSLPRLTVMLLNLYDNHIGANEKESDIKEIKQGHISFYLDVDFVNTMSRSDLTSGWRRYPCRDAKMSDGPTTWTGFKTSRPHTDAEMEQYYTKLSETARTLDRMDDYNYCYERLKTYTADMTPAETALQIIDCHIARREFHKAKGVKASIVFDTVEQQATAGVAISRELFRRLFIEDMLDELDTLKNILPEVGEDSRLGYEIRLLDIEQRLFSAYFNLTGNELNEYIRNDILPALQLLFDKLHNRGWHDANLSKVARLIGFANMIIGQYDFGMRGWLDSSVAFAMNISGKSTPAFAEAMVIYGLGFMTVGNPGGNADLHVRDSTLSAHKADRLCNPWLVNALCISMRMSLNKDSHELLDKKLDEITELVHGQPDRYGRELFDAITDYHSSRQQIKFNILTNDITP